MPAPREAAVRIQVFVRSHGSELIVTRGESRRVFPNRLTSRNLAAHCEQFYEGLGRFRAQFTNELSVLDYRRLTRAMRELHDNGRSLAWDLFGHGVREVQDILRRAFPRWMAPKGDPPILAMDARPGECVPIEFLPLFDLSELTANIRSVQELQAATRSFVGFSACVARILRRDGHAGGQSSVALGADRLLWNRSGLPMKFFQHAGLSGARHEAQFLLMNPHCVDLDGPWPDQDYDERDLARRVATHLRDPSLRFDGSRRDVPDQVQHFACHTGTRKGAVKDDYVKLAHARGADRIVRLQALKSHFAALVANDETPTRPSMPLIFLNGCDSAVSDPASVTTFPEFFLLDNGNRGFLGVEANVPDKVAATFSKQFYSYLLQGCCLGTAVHRAKWDLLEDFHNPLGLLYTVYADPDIGVLKPIAVNDPW